MLLMIGETELKNGNFMEAMLAYPLLISTYPYSKICEFAQKSIAEIYETKLSQREQAIKEYELMLTQYPESLLIETVRNRIRDLEKSN